MGEGGSCGKPASRGSPVLVLDDHLGGKGGFECIHGGGGTASNLTKRTLEKEKKQLR